jgi:hypothetical protein
MRWKDKEWHNERNSVDTSTESYVQEANRAYMCMMMMGLIVLERVRGYLRETQLQMQEKRNAP